MKGIYCFTNKVNGKKYIGQSCNIENRYKSHKRNYLNANLQTYNGKFYRALRKYGFDNFTFTILEASENFNQKELNQKEIYYINKFDSFINGYNMNYGGRYTSNGIKKLNEQQVLQIKELIQNTDISFQEISRKYGLDVNGSLISMINSGAVWNIIGQYDYPIRKNTYFRNIGGTNPRAIFSDEEVIEIRQRYVHESMPDIYVDYKDRCSFSELKKIVYGSQFKNLPCYKKRSKTWVLGETCIDYPRLEE